MKFKTAAQLHKETLDAQVEVWRSFEKHAFEEMEIAKACGRMMARIEVHRDVYDPQPLVDKLKASGYSVTITSDRDGNAGRRLLVGWRQPGPVAKHIKP